MVSLMASESSKIKDVAFNELIAFDFGVYQLKSGAIIRYNLCPYGNSDDYSASFVYGVGDFIEIGEYERNYHLFKSIAYTHLTKICDLNYRANENWYQQLRKSEALLTALGKKIHYRGKRGETKPPDNRVMAVVEWIDDYFDYGAIRFSHRDIASIALSTRVTVTRELMHFVKLGILENTKIKTVSNGSFIIGKNKNIFPNKRIVSLV